MTTSRAFVNSIVRMFLHALHALHCRFLVFSFHSLRRGGADATELMKVCKECRSPRK